MNNQENNIINSFKDETGKFFMVSFGVFLFILFFQPFPLEQLDYNNRLLFVTGFGAITFFLSCLVFILLPFSLPNWFQSLTNHWEGGPNLLLNIILLVLTSTAFVFYIRYVGMVPITLYVVFKVILVCLLPLIIFLILYKNRSLERSIEVLQDQNNALIEKLSEYETLGEEEQIEIQSENKSDELTLKYKNIVIIRSADNYIEIYYQGNGGIEKKLIRTTLKNIESQLANKNSFVRCHRTSIVNVNYINKLARNYNGHHIIIPGLEETIPISRQYLMQVKDAIRHVIHPK